MKVIYDATVLGIGLRNERARTGVFRVVDNVAEGLATSPEVDLSFCATAYINDSVAYLSRHPKYKSKPIILPHNDGSPWKYLYEKLNHKEEMLSAAPEVNPVATLYHKIIRKGVGQAKKLLPAPNFSNQAQTIDKANIYHSPFQLIPEEIRSLDKVVRFLTVYDLIPILYPQFFKFKENHMVSWAIKSLGSKGWAFAISQATKNDLCSYAKIDPERVMVTPLAASPEVFFPVRDQEARREVQQKYAIPDAPYFLSLSTLEPRKNIDHVIRTFSRLVQQEQLRDLYLVLVGTKGWDFDKIFAEIAKTPLIKSRIVVTGFVPDRDLAAIYSGAISFVYTSFYEGFGLPPLEAMQCGVPVITSDNSSLPEVVWEAGFMVGATDSDALAQRMLEIYDNAALREKMGRLSSERAASFSWARCVEEIIKGYKKALA